jgi:uncharacterized protein YpmS
MGEWKEYTTLIIAAVTLVVAIAAFIVARRTLRVTRRAHEYAKESEKRNILTQISCKEAQAEAIDSAIRRGMYDNGMVRTMMTQKAMLDAEIKQLKEQLGK